MALSCTAVDNFLPSNTENPVAPVTLSAFLQVESAPLQIGAIHTRCRSDSSLVGSSIDFDSINQAAHRLSKSSDPALINFSHFAFDVPQLPNPLSLEERFSSDERNNVNQQLSLLEIDNPITGQALFDEYSTVEENILLTEIDPDNRAISSRSSILFGRRRYQVS